MDISSTEIVIQLNIVRFSKQDSDEVSEHFDLVFNR